MISAQLRIESPDSETILSSIRPESLHQFPRTHVEMTGAEGVVMISIETTDTTAMRAALNSYLGCVRITEDIRKITKVN